MRAPVGVVGIVIISLKSQQMLENMWSPNMSSLQESCAPFVLKFVLIRKVCAIIFTTLISLLNKFWKIALSYLQVLKMLWHLWCIRLLQTRALFGVASNVIISLRLKPMWQSMLSPNMSSLQESRVPFATKCVLARKVYGIIVTAITNPVNNKCHLTTSSIF